MFTTSTAAIQQHYDLSNDFYALWLDRGMVYSAALWRDDSETLEQAQHAKLRYHADAVRAKPGDRLLDIGCGWGAMLHCLVRDYGVAHVTGLTLSEAQCAYFAQHTTSDRAHVVLSGWEDYVDDSQVDGIVVIGSFEHFGRRDQSAEQRHESYTAFFDFARRRLPQGGRIALQTITYGRLRKLPQFIEQTIWTESELPTLAEIAGAASRWFEVEVLVNHRHHYARTLKEWNSRLAASRAVAVSIVGAKKVQDYVRYLDLSQGAFETGGLQLLRLTLRKTTK